MREWNLQTTYFVMKANQPRLLSLGDRLLSAATAETFPRLCMFPLLLLRERGVWEIHQPCFSQFAGSFQLLGEHVFASKVFRNGFRCSCR